VRPYLKKNQNKKGLMELLVELTLSSSSSTTKKQKKERKVATSRFPVKTTFKANQHLEGHL
jgi:hypothetical protein